MLTFLKKLFCIHCWGGHFYEREEVVDTKTGDLYFWAACVKCGKEKWIKD